MDIFNINMEELLKQLIEDCIIGIKLENRLDKEIIDFFKNNFKTSYDFKQDFKGYILSGVITRYKHSEYDFIFYLSLETLKHENPDILILSQQQFIKLLNEQF